MGDKYVGTNVGQMGPNAQARDINFNQVWEQNQGELRLDQLAEDLGKLRAHLKSNAGVPEEDAQVGAVASAELAAKNGDGPGALEALSKAGKWALDNASKIGVAVAAAALKSALGV